jgi:hypothetical protein
MKRTILTGYTAYTLLLASSKNGSQLSETTMIIAAASA